MKKQVLSLIAVASSILGFSQEINPTAEFNQLPHQINLAPSSQPYSHPLPQQSQNRGVSLWSDDFSTPSNWTLDNDGQSGINYGWNINTTSESWFTGYDFPTGINSTSGGNFAEVQNGNYNNSDQAINVNYNMTTASPININSLTSGHNNVLLQFQQYGGLFNDSQVFQISTDGINWTTVGSNSVKTTFVGNNPAALYANPETVSINIASAIASNPSTVWIRFSWTSKNPSSSTPTAWTTFGWYIDNVEIVEAEQHDLSLISADWTVAGYTNRPVNYYKTPISQIRPMNFDGTYANAGLNDMTNCMFTADVNSGLFTSSSADGTLSSLDTISTVTTGSYTPPAALGSYSLNYSISSTETDDTPLDNIQGPVTFEITDSVMARDNGIPSGTYYNSGEAFELGCAYNLANPATAQFIDVKVSSFSNPGTIMFGIIKDGANNVLDSTFEYTLTATDISNEAIISMPLKNKIPLLSNKTYNVLVRTNGDGGATNDLVVVMAQTPPISTTIFTNELGNNYYTLKTPMVRLKLGDIPAYDLGLNGFYNYANRPTDSSIQYFSTPISQIQEWEFASSIVNKGSLLQNNTIVSLDINSGLFTTSTAPQTISPGVTVFYDTMLNTFTPPSTVASYDVTYTVSSPSTDYYPIDNTATETYEITTDYYSRDWGVSNGSYSLGADDVGIGNVYDIVAPQPVEALEFPLLPFNDPILGTYLEPVIYEFDGNDWVVLHTGDGYNVTSQDITNGYISLGFVNSGQYILPVGEYLFSVNTVFAGANTIFIPVSNYAQPGTAFTLDTAGTMEDAYNPMISLRMGDCQNVLASKPQPTINFQNLENYVCSGTCVSEVFLNVENASYVEIYDENQTLIGSDSIQTFQSNYTDTILGTFCLGETYKAVAKSRCDDNSPFVQVGDTLFFQIDTSNIDITINVINESVCLADDGSATFTGDFPNGTAPNYTINWNGPVTGTVSGVGSGSSITASLGNNLTAGNYTGEYINTDLGCDPVAFTFNVVANSLTQDVCVVTVDEFTSTYNILVWEKPANMQAVDSFFVYREITTNNYQKIGAVDGDDLSEYEDFTANPNSTNYRYKLSVLDSCGIEGAFSLYHHSIHLQYLGGGNFQWTPYEIEATSNQIASYNFYRDDQATGNFVLLQVIPGTNVSFSDVDYATFPNAVYRVDVVWSSGLVCTSTKANTNTSRSNKKNQVVSSTPDAIIELLSEGTTISPVPASDEIKLKVPSSIKNANFKIMNSIGQVVYSATLKEELTTLNISDFTNGVYIVVIETTLGSIAKKLIKE